MAPFLSPLLRSISFASTISSAFRLTDSFDWEQWRDNRQPYPLYWKTLFSFLYYFHCESPLELDLCVLSGFYSTKIFPQYGPPIPFLEATSFIVLHRSHVPQSFAALLSAWEILRVLAMPAAHFYRVTRYKQKEYCPLAALSSYTSSPRLCQANCSSEVKNKHENVFATIHFNRFLDMKSKPQIQWRYTFFNKTFSQAYTPSPFPSCSCK